MSLKKYLEEIQAAPAGDTKDRMLNFARIKKNLIKQKDQLFDFFVKKNQQDYKKLTSSQQKQLKEFFEKKFELNY